jgi:3-phenylpropionate/trans-cinnamate dioxygenase ferredoxin reductase subunit
MGNIVIVGAGQAGLSAAEALRSGGFQGSIDLLSDEPYGPYHRPPLSKAWMAGEMDSAQLAMRAPEMLARKNIVLHSGSAVTRVDRAQQRVVMADGSSVPYTGLVLATGSSPRRLSLPGMDAAGVFVLRSRDDAQSIAQHMERCIEQQRELIVIGGGFIGLEVAATARKKGLAVTVLEAAPRLLGRVLAPVLSDWYARLHRDHGVKLVLDARIDRLETGPDGTVSAHSHSIVAGGLLERHRSPG